MSPSLHARTPNLIAVDGRGLPIRQVAYLRQLIGGAQQTLVTRQRHDAAGRLLEQTDPRLAPNTPNLTSGHHLSGALLKIDSVDAGWRLSLLGLAGEELQRWDARGGHWRITYDGQLRPLDVEENSQPHVERFVYGDASADPMCNLRGQMTQQLDRSVTLTFNSYSLLGLPRHETQALLEGIDYPSSRTYSPLGVLLSQTDAAGHQQQLRYDIAGQLHEVQLRLKEDVTWKQVLKSAQYDAAGRLIEQRAGNDVLSTWTFDPANDRLSTQRARKIGGSTLQDIEYFYDPVGNITRLEDHLFEPIHFANQRVDGHRD
ncbi:toxin, partial [Pseudomonas sp. NPDC086278]